MAESKGQPSRLEDVINYKPEEYFSEDELNLIRNTFRGEMGLKLIKVLRKAFIPTVNDPELPVESFQNDSFLMGLDYNTIPTDQVKSIVMGRQHAVKLVFGALIKLKVIAHTKYETPDELEAKANKDSLR